MNRKLIRPSLATARGASGPSPRRTVLAETTHAEAGYLVQAIESRAPFVAQVFGGTEVRGRLEAYDKNALIVARDGKPALVLSKDRLRCFWVEPAESPSPRR